MSTTTGDSKLPIPEGSDILARYVQNWKGLRSGSSGIVILKGEQDFVFKEITVLAQGLTLHSFNKLYDDYPVDFSEVLEIW